MIHRVFLNQDIYLEVERGWDHFLLNSNEQFRKGDILAIYYDDNNPYNNVKRCFGTICKMSIPYGSGRRVFIEKPKEEIIFPLKTDGRKPDEITLIVKTEDNCVLVCKVNDRWHLPIVQIKSDEAIDEIAEKFLAELTNSSCEIDESYMLCKYEKRKFASMVKGTYGCIWFIKARKLYSGRDAELFDMKKDEKTIIESQIPFMEMILRGEELNRIRALYNYEYFVDQIMSKQSQNNTKFAIRLRNGENNFHPKIFNLYSKIDIEAIKKEMNISEDSSGVLEVCKFENHKLVAQLCFDMQGQPVHWEVVL